MECLVRCGYAENACKLKKYNKKIGDVYRKRVWSCSEDRRRKEGKAINILKIR